MTTIALSPASKANPYGALASTGSTRETRALNVPGAISPKVVKRYKAAGGPDGSHPTM